MLLFSRSSFLTNLARCGGVLSITTATFQKCFCISLRYAAKVCAPNCSCVLKNCLLSLVMTPYTTILWWLPVYGRMISSPRGDQCLQPDATSCTKSASSSSAMVNPSSSRHEIRFSKRYCQFQTAFLLARLTWTLCETWGSGRPRA